MPCQVIHGDSGEQAWRPGLLAYSLVSGLCHVTCHCSARGVRLGQAAPLGLRPKPASAAPGKEQGHLRTGTKEPPALGRWALFDPNCQSDSAAAAWLLGLPAPAKAAPMVVFQNIHREGSMLPK